MYLNCKTYYSYCYGTYSAAELVAAAVEAGATSLALTNINNTSDCWDFVAAAAKAGIRAVVGVEIRNEDEFCYLLLARNNNGFEQINRFLSMHLTTKQPFEDRPAFTAEQQVVVIYPMARLLSGDGSFGKTLAPHEFIGVQITEINKLIAINMEAVADRLVVRQPVSFADKRTYNLHRLLRAIHHNIILSKQQDTHRAGAHETFMPQDRLMAYYSRYPQILTNTLRLMDSCSIKMEFHKDKNKLTTRYYASSP